MPLQRQKRAKPFPEDRFSEPAGCLLDESLCKSSEGDVSGAAGTRPTSSWQGPSRCGALLLGHPLRGLAASHMPFLLRAGQTGSNYPGLQRFHAHGSVLHSGALAFELCSLGPASMQKTFTVVASSTRARWQGSYKLKEEEMSVPESLPPALERVLFERLAGPLQSASRSRSTYRPRGKLCFKDQLRAWFPEGVPSRPSVDSFP